MRIASKPLSTIRGGGYSRHPILVLFAALLVAGCAGKPNAANIELRKQNETLATDIARLNTELNAREATIKTLEASTPTLPTLPAERLNELYTVHGLVLGRLTGGADLDPSNPGTDGLKIYVVPTDAAGDELKSAGSFKIEAFDLAAAEPRVGAWAFTVEEAKSNWNGSGLLYEYVLPCPFDSIPAHEEITIKVTFTDALTQRQTTEQKIVKLRP